MVLWSQPTTGGPDFTTAKLVQAAPKWMRPLLDKFLATTSIFNSLKQINHMYVALRLMTKEVGLALVSPVISYACAVYDMFVSNTIVAYSAMPAFSSVKDSVVAYVMTRFASTPLPCSSWIERRSASELVGLALGVLGVVSQALFGKNFDFSTILGNFGRTYVGIKTAVHDLLGLLGIGNLPEEQAREQLTELIKEGQEISVIRGQDFGYPQIARARRWLTEVDTHMKLDVFKKVADSRLMSLHTSVLSAMKTALQTRMSGKAPPKPVSLHFSGKPGAGKSHLCRVLASEIPASLGVAKSSQGAYAITASPHFGPYLGEFTAIMEEFAVLLGTTGGNEKLAAILSMTGGQWTPLPGAHLEAKANISMVGLVLASANDQLSKIAPQGTASSTVRDALLSRFWCLEIQDPQATGSRSVKPHAKPDFSHARIIVREHPISFPLAGQIKEYPVDSEITYYQLKEAIKAQIIHNAQQTNGETENVPVSEATQPDIAKAFGYPYASYHVSVVNISGPPNQGKTHILETLKRISPQLSIAEGTSVSNVPKVHILDDHQIFEDELAYNRWFDALPKGSAVVIATNKKRSTFGWLRGASAFDVRFGNVSGPSTLQITAQNGKFSYEGCDTKDTSIVALRIRTFLIQHMSGGLVEADDVTIQPGYTRALHIILDEETRDIQLEASLLDKAKLATKLSGVRLETYAEGLTGPAFYKTALDVLCLLRRRNFPPLRITTKKGQKLFYDGTRLYYQMNSPTAEFRPEGVKLAPPVGEQRLFSYEEANELWHSQQPESPQEVELLFFLREQERTHGRRQLERTLENGGELPSSEDYWGLLKKWLLHEPNLILVCVAVLAVLAFYQATKVAGCDAQPMRCQCHICEPTPCPSKAGKKFARGPAKNNDYELLYEDKVDSLDKAKGSKMTGSTQYWANQFGEQFYHDIRSHVREALEQDGRVDVYPYTPIEHIVQDRTPVLSLKNKIYKNIVTFHTRDASCGYALMLTDRVGVTVAHVWEASNQIVKYLGQNGPVEQTARVVRDLSHKDILYFVLGRPGPFQNLMQMVPVREQLSGVEEAWGFSMRAGSQGDIVQVPYEFTELPTNWTRSRTNQGWSLDQDMGTVTTVNPSGEIWQAGDSGTPFFGLSRQRGKSPAYVLVGLFSAGLGLQLPSKLLATPLVTDTIDPDPHAKQDYEISWTKTPEGSLIPADYAEGFDWKRKGVGPSLPNIQTYYATKFVNPDSKGAWVQEENTIPLVGPALPYAELDRSDPMFRDDTERWVPYMPRIKALLETSPPEPKGFRGFCEEYLDFNYLAIGSPKNLEPLTLNDSLRSMWGSNMNPNGATGPIITTLFPTTVQRRQLYTADNEVSFADTQAAAYFQAYLDQAWKYAKNGETVAMLSGLQRKVELLPAAKTYKSRLFFPVDAGYNALIRKVLLRVQKLYQAHIFTVAPVVGMDPNTDTTGLVASLLEMGPTGFCIDVSAFDLSLPDWLLPAVVRHIVGIYRNSGTPERTLKGIEKILEGAIDPYVHVEKTLMALKKKMASGVFGTNFMDSLASDIMVSYVLCKLLDVSYTQLLKLAKVFVCGDDVVVTLSPRAAERIDVGQLPRLYKEIFGVNITAGLKDGSKVGLVPLENGLSFCSAQFVKNPLMKGIWMPLYKPETVSKLLHFYKRKLTTSERLASLLNARDLFAAQPEEIRAEMEDLIRKWAYRAKVDYPVETHKTRLLRLGALSAMDINTKQRVMRTLQKAINENDVIAYYDIPTRTERNICLMDPFDFEWTANTRRAIRLAVATGAHRDARLSWFRELSYERVKFLGLFDKQNIGGVELPYPTSHAWLWLWTQGTWPQEVKDFILKFLSEHQQNTKLSQHWHLATLSLRFQEQLAGTQIISLMLATGRDLQDLLEIYNQQEQSQWASNQDQVVVDNSRSQEEKLENQNIQDSVTRSQEPSKPGQEASSTLCESRPSLLSPGESQGPEPCAANLVPIDQSLHHPDATPLLVYKLDGFSMVPASTCWYYGPQSTVAQAHGLLANWASAYEENMGIVHKIPYGGGPTFRKETRSEATVHYNRIAPNKGVVTKYNNCDKWTIVFLKPEADPEPCNMPPPDVDATMNGAPSGNASMENAMLSHSLQPADPAVMATPTASVIQTANSSPAVVLSMPGHIDPVRGIAKAGWHLDAESAAFRRAQLSVVRLPVPTAARTIVSAISVGPWRSECLSPAALNWANQHERCYGGGVELQVSYNGSASIPGRIIAAVLPRQQDGQQIQTSDLSPEFLQQFPYMEAPTSEPWTNNFKIHFTSNEQTYLERDKDFNAVSGTLVVMTLTPIETTFGNPTMVPFSLSAALTSDTVYSIPRSLIPASLVSDQQPDLVEAPMLDLTRAVFVVDGNRQSSLMRALRKTIPSIPGVPWMHDNFRIEIDTLPIAGDSTSLVGLYALDSGDGPFSLLTAPVRDSGSYAPLLEQGRRPIFVEKPECSYVSDFDFTTELLGGDQLNSEFSQAFPKFPNFGLNPVGPAIFAPGTVTAETVYMPRLQLYRGNDGNVYTNPPYVAKLQTLNTTVNERTRTMPEIRATSSFVPTANTTSSELPFPPTQYKQVYLGTAPSRGIPGVTSQGIGGGQTFRGTASYIAFMDKLQRTLEESGQGSFVYTLTDAVSNVVAEVLANRYGLWVNPNNSLRSLQYFALTGVAVGGFTVRSIPHTQEWPLIQELHPNQGWLSREATPMQVVTDENGTVVLETASPVPSASLAATAAIGGISAGGNLISDLLGFGKAKLNSRLNQDQTRLEAELNDKLLRQKGAQDRQLQADIAADNLAAYGEQARLARGTMKVGGNIQSNLMSQGYEQQRSLNKQNAKLELQNMAALRGFATERINQRIR